MSSVMKGDQTSLPWRTISYDRATFVLRPLPWCRQVGHLSLSLLQAPISLYNTDSAPSGNTLNSLVIRAKVSKMPHFCLMLPEVLSLGVSGQHLYSQLVRREGRVGPEAASLPRPLWDNAGKISASNFEFQNMELFGMSIGKFYLFLFCTAFRDKNRCTI